MDNLFAFGLTSAITIVLLTSSANVGDGLPMNNKMKYLTNSNHTQQIQSAIQKTYQTVQKLNNTKNIIPKPVDTVLQNVKNGSTYRIGKPSKGYVLQGSKWPVKNLTYKIQNYPKRLKKSDVDAEISKAFNVWSEHSQLNFKSKTNGSVNIDISFDNIENGDPFDGRGKTLARAYYPISGGNVYFDIAENWTIGKRRGINLFTAAAHEIGHSLGLNHSDSTSSIMAKMYKGYDPEFKLSEEDISGIQALYGKKNTIR